MKKKFIIVLLLLLCFVITICSCDYVSEDEYQKETSYSKIVQKEDGPAMKKFEEFRRKQSEK